MADEKTQKLFDEWQKARADAREYTNEINLIRVTALPYTTSDSLFWLYVIRGRVNLRDHKLKVLGKKLIHAEDRITMLGLKLNICLYKTGAVMVEFRKKPCLVDYNSRMSAHPICLPRVYVKGSFNE